MKYTNSTNQHINCASFHNVTNLGLYNKLIFVTQKQVLEFYIIVIELKTLNGLMVPHTTFPKCITSATKATTNKTTRVHVTKAVIATATKATTNKTTRVHVTKAVIGTRHKIGGEAKRMSNNTANFAQCADCTDQRM